MMHGASRVSGGWELAESLIEIDFWASRLNDDGGVEKGPSHIELG